ncbi:hypothetical protein D3C86_1425720 [compost metagenome]
MREGGVDNKLTSTTVTTNHFNQRFPIDAIEEQLGPSSTADNHVVHEATVTVVLLTSRCGKDVAVWSTVFLRFSTSGSSSSQCSRQGSTDVVNERTFVDVRNRSGESPTQVVRSRLRVLRNTSGVVVLVVLTGYFELVV